MLTPPFIRRLIVQFTAVLGWSAGGDVNENVSSGSGVVVGYLFVDTPAIPNPISTITIDNVGSVSFLVDVNTFEVRAFGEFDYESLQVASLSVFVTTVSGDDNGPNGEQVSLYINNVAEAPTGLNLTAAAVNENSSVGTVVATLTGQDPEGGALTYSWVSGAGFSVVGNQLRVSGALNHEATSSVNVTIRVTDAQSNFQDFVRNIVINDVAEAPTGLNLTASAVNENSSVGSVVATLTGVDPEGGALTYAWVSGTGFSVVGNQLRVAGPLNHEATPTRDVVISVTDAQSNTTQFTRTITINDVNEAPTIAAFANVSTVSIAENSAAGRAVGRVVFSDPDVGDNVSLSLIGADASNFVLDGDVIRVAPGAVFDFDSHPTLSFSVRATDTSNLTANQAFTVNLLDVLSQEQSVQAVVGGNGTSVGLSVTVGVDGPVITLSKPR